MADQSQIQDLYENWISSWNEKSADKMASLVGKNGHVIGFDGSQMSGPMEVQSTLGQIFKDYPTAEYISIIKEIRFLSSDIALIRSVVGMVPRGGSQVNPNVNAIQTVIFQKEDQDWKIISLQNTPAAFHGRPNEVFEMTQELQNQFEKKSKVSTK
jgi:uncharacterized protein (TIGR02246 family)